MFLGRERERGRDGERKRDAFAFGSIYFFAFYIILGGWMWMNERKETRAFGHGKQVLELEYTPFPKESLSLYRPNYRIPRLLLSSLAIRGRQPGPNLGGLGWAAPARPMSWA